MKQQSWHIFRLILLCHVTQIVATATRPDTMELDQEIINSYLKLFFLEVNHLIINCF